MYMTLSHLENLGGKRVTAVCVQEYIEIEDFLQSFQTGLLLTKKGFCAYISTLNQWRPVPGLGYL